MRTAKSLIRLGGCPGWSESSLGAHFILLVLPLDGSFFHSGFSVSEKKPVEEPLSIKVSDKMLCSLCDVVFVSRSDQVQYYIFSRVFDSFLSNFLIWLDTAHQFASQWGSFNLLTPSRLSILRPRLFFLLLKSSKLYHKKWTFLLFSRNIEREKN